jgi:hypothetical protein
MILCAMSLSICDLLCLMHISVENAFQTCIKWIYLNFRSNKYYFISFWDKEYAHIWKQRQNKKDRQSLRLLLWRIKITITIIISRLI